MSSILTNTMKIKVGGKFPDFKLKDEELPENGKFPN